MWVDLLSNGPNGGRIFSEFLGSTSRTLLKLLSVRKPHTGPPQVHALGPHQRSGVQVHEPVLNQPVTDSHSIISIIYCDIML